MDRRLISFSIANHITLTHNRVLGIKYKGRVMSRLTVFIHTGHLSLDNGARGPLSQYFDLARLMDTPAKPGQFYGDDRLEVEEGDWPVLESLLIEMRLLYRVQGQHQTWQNVRSPDDGH